MLLDRYFEAIDELYEHVRSTQREAIVAAGTLIADRVEQGGKVRIFDSGHIVNQELIHRAGGLHLLRRLEYTGGSGSVHEAAVSALEAEDLGEKDVLIMGTVSGKAERIIELALAAREKGITLITLTSITYSQALTSEHASGKRLFELGDIVLDNCAPFGDAMLEVDGLEPKVCPASGLAASFIMWAVMAVVIEKMMEKGLNPSVFKSHNRPGGPEYNEKQQEIFEKQGY